MPPSYDPEEQEKLAEIEAAQKQVHAAGERIKELKAASASKEEIEAAVQALNEARNKEKTLVRSIFFQIQNLIPPFFLFTLFLSVRRIFSTR
jgi:seryl-tRNA synthetase